jgi:hypothetical protein
VLELNNAIKSTCLNWKGFLSAGIDNRASSVAKERCVALLPDRDGQLSSGDNYKRLSALSLLSSSLWAENVIKKNLLTKPVISRETGSSKLISQKALCMKGTIRTLEKCPVCEKPFARSLHPVTGDVIFLSCETATCKTHPRYVYIDARNMGAGKIYTDQHGHLFDSFGVAYRQLEAMRRDFDEKKFDPSQWAPSMRKLYAVTETCSQWLKHLKSTVGDSHYTHCKGVMELHVKPVLEKLKLVDIRDLQTIHVDAVYVALLSGGYDKKTVKNYMQHFHQYCKHWVDRDVLIKMPKFPEVTVPEKFKPWIPVEKQIIILSKVPDKDDNLLLIETFLQGGHRPSELIAHFKRDIQEGELIVHQAFDSKGKLKPPKTLKILRRGVSLSLFNRLLEHCENKSPQDFIFTRAGERPYSYDAFYHLWTNAAEAAGIKIAPVAGARRSKASQVREELEKEMKQKLRDVLDHESNAYKAYARDRSEKI